ncbi:SIR2 family protein [Alicyclobacillus acidoterrestris]|uniref:SIR2 family protein n=1 Tax=Alicyclobacillus acidoterrestris (strain ATCC 49025 / DSM 3922 / CIP 106132 / NCIMB 13137 / GD3B) TaxID=1356854 RepID=T0C471_ALIAG|nr:SIR2 family protein [Alicyclobacillus acidoterrestris]EPZ47365.1 hypothetical protein N007_06460 [Alicyclobacillus acidoterrestris ATCC 49025]UNO49065.1 SIR2 family protein [Alicyclobacillus acidoterrestris]
MEWTADTNYYRMGPKEVESAPDESGVLQAKRDIEPWLSAVFQSEHLSVLLGSGFTTAVSHVAGVTSTTMSEIQFGDLGKLPYEDRVNEFARESAKAMGRGDSNIEDQIRAANTLLEGLKIIRDSNVTVWEDAINRVLGSFMISILETEAGIERAIRDGNHLVERVLVSLLLSFASRTASRERLNLFTTNYDRLVEYGCDLVGLRSIDRFVGALTPIFRSSRIDVDMHYNPPGIRGEPRFLEGVVRYTKLHGSIDWRFENNQLRRYTIPFGAPSNHTDVVSRRSESVMIYPNPAKDVETLEFPYADLFRDFSSALCRPNSALVTYGYGFGDDHINRVLADMLTIPSTHLVIISWDHANGRIESFLDKVGRHAQISLMVGHHFGDIQNLVNYYLPKPSIDEISIRKAALVTRRTSATEDQPSTVLDSQSIYGGERP